MSKNKKEKSKEVELLSDTKAEKVKKIIIETCFYDGHPKDVLRKCEAILQEKATNIETQEKNKILNQALALTGLTSHFPVGQAVKDEFKPLAIEFTDNIIDEYNCSTPSEKALAQTISVSYTRIMALSWQITSTLSLNKATSNLNQFLGNISKDLDRANRQFLSALATLKNIKQPQIKINLKTNTTFITQNQQINSNQYEENNNT